MLRRPALVASTAAAALALALGVSGPATAAPAHPVARTTAAAPARSVVSRAVVHHVYVAIARDRQLRGWKSSEWRVQRIQVTSSGTWARATVHPTKGRTDDATVLLRKVRGTWRVVDLGTAQVGCGIAPRTVLRTLHLGGC